MKKSLAKNFTSKKKFTDDFQLVYKLVLGFFYDSHTLWLMKKSFLSVLIEKSTTFFLRKGKIFEVLKIFTSDS